MAQRWYVKQDAQELGPFSDSGLRRFLESDQARPGALVSNGQGGPWLPASQFGAVQPAQGGAAAPNAAAAPASGPASATVNPAAYVAQPIATLTNDGAQRSLTSRPAVLLAAGMGASVLVLLSCLGIWLLVQRLSAPRPIAAAPPPNVAPPSQAVAELENETERLRQELAELQVQLREQQQEQQQPQPQPLADAKPAPSASEPRDDKPRDDKPRDDKSTAEHKQRVEMLRTQIRAAIAALDADLAGQKLKQYLALVDGDERDRATNLLAQLDGARLETLLQYVRDMPEDARQALAEKGSAPADLMRLFDDEDLVKALQTQLPRLAGLVVAEAKDRAWQQLGEDARRKGDLATLRKWAFLQQAFAAKLDGQLTPDRVAGLVDQFGVFRLEGEPSLLDALLAEPAEAETAFRKGGQLQTASTDLFAECRKLAGDAWPPDDRPHPFAGRWTWTGVATWDTNIKPADDAITFVDVQGNAFDQRICKIGPDYLVAYELRWRIGGGRKLPSRDLTLATPFDDAMEPQIEANLDPQLPYSDFGPHVYFLLTLFRRAGKSATKLAVYRTEQDKTFSAESLLTPDDDIWSKLGVAGEYHLEGAGFRRAKDQRKP